MSDRPVPRVQRHLPRGTTLRSAARARNRMAANTNNPAQSDVINQTGGLGTRVLQTTGGSEAIGAGLIVSWDNSNPGSYDVGEWFDPLTPTLITVSKDGFYLATANVNVNGATGTNLSLSIAGSGVIGGRAVFFPVLAGHDTNMQVTFILSAAAGDSIFVSLTSQNNSGNVDSDVKNDFTVYYLGASAA